MSKLSLISLQAFPLSFLFPTQLLLAMKSQPEETFSSLDPANKTTPHPFEASTHSSFSSISLGLLPFPLQQQATLTSHSGTHVHPHSSLLLCSGPPLALPIQPNWAPVLPLLEVAGMDRLVKVHVPFSLSELSLKGKRKTWGLVSLTPLFSLMNPNVSPDPIVSPFHDIYMIPTICFLRSAGEIGSWLEHMQMKSTKLTQHTEGLRYPV